MTGVAFVLFTFYMITDPATTPSDPMAQVVFGLAVAAAYGLIVAARGVFAMFFALTVICAIRGFVLYVTAIVRARAAPQLFVTLRRGSAVTVSGSDRC
jgi:hypothetical protein